MLLYVSSVMNSSLCVTGAMGVSVGDTNCNSDTGILNTCMRIYNELSVVCIELVCFDDGSGKRL